MASQGGECWPVTAAIRVATDALIEAGIESARLDAEVLAATAIGISRERLLTWSPPLPADAIRRFDSYLERRKAHEPIAYIIGRKEFFSLEFEVTPTVLIPRPETETVVAAALEILRKRTRARELRVLEIGVGSGAIAIAIGVNEPRADIVATDISADALALARHNATRHGVAARIHFELTDLWPAGAPSERLFDLVISNPPYIASSAISGLPPEVACYEPRIALDGGADGLDFYRRIAAGTRRYLAAGGHAVVEIGTGQAAEVTALFGAHGADDLSTILDLAGCPRVIVARYC